MSTIGIIALSLLGGLFVALLIAISAYQCWMILQFQRALAELRSSIASASASQTKLKEETRSAIETERKLIADSFSLHQSQLTIMISKINGEGLERASRSISQSANRIEKAALAFGELASAIFSDRDSAATRSQPVVGRDIDENGYAMREPGEGAYITPSENAVLDETKLEDIG